MNRVVYVLLVTALFLSCRSREERPMTEREEDQQAKEMLQGIWIDEEEGEPSFRVRGDTIYYPDTISMPAHYRIYTDTLVIEGASDVKYPIVRLAEHLLEFQNPGGETIRLVKSEDKDDESFFHQASVVVLNQNRIIKRDSVMQYGTERYHCYVQVNPTTYKVIKSTYNDDGVAVGNVYYDNTIHVAVFHGAQRVFSRDFKKQDFAKYIPADFLSNSILSDMPYEHADEKGIHYEAQLCIPDSPSSYRVNAVVSYDGRLTLSLAE